MADDNILEIGATIDLSSFLPGVDKMGVTTRSVTQAMGQSFQQLATTTLASTAQMTTAFVAVPAAAQVIPETIRKVEATTASGTRAMEVSWRELATNVKESSLGIVESLGEVGAKISETAERSRLGIGTMEAGFAGLSTILGAGIAVGFAADFLDETSRVLIELEHLSTTTQISVQTLGGLRNVTQQAAVPFQAVQVALVRMQRAQVEALEGMTEYQRAFRDLGISMDELKKLSPEDLFFRLAEAISQAKNPQLAVSGGIEVMGRGMYTLLPLLEKYGSNLRQVTEEAGRTSGANDKAAETAMRWHKETAQISQLFQSFMIPVLQGVVNIIPKVVVGFDMIGASLLALAGPIAFVINETTTFLAGITKLTVDLITFNFRDIPKTIAQVASDMTRIFKGAFNDITENLRAARADWDNLLGGKPKRTIFDQAKEDMDALFKKPVGELNLPTTTKSDVLAQWRSQLDQMRDAQIGFHELSKADEAAFWKSKLELAKNNVKLYREVYHEYVTAERAARKEALSEEMANTEEALAQTRSGSAERIVIIREEIDHLKAIGAEETADYKRLQNQLLEAVRQRTEAEKKLAEQKAKQQQAINAIEAEIAQSGEQSKLEIRRSHLATEESLGLVTARQRLAIDRQIIAEEIGLEKQALEAKLVIYRQEPVEYERIKKQIAELDNKYNRLIAQNDDQMLKLNLSRWQHFNQQVTNGFSTAVGRWIETGRGFGTALAQQWNQMVAQWGVALARMLAQFVLHNAAKLVIHHATETAQTASTTQGELSRSAIQLAHYIKWVAMKLSELSFYVLVETAKIAATVAAEGKKDIIQTAKFLGQITAFAAHAAAKVFHDVIVSLPFPANIIVAPIAAAGVFAGVAAYKGLAGGKAEKGGLLSEDGPIFAHAKEMILPAPIATGFQNLVTAGGLNLPPALSQNFNSIGGASSSSQTTTTNHYHNTVSPKIAVSVQGTSDGMKDLHETVMKTIKRALRNGTLGFEGA